MCIPQAIATRSSGVTRQPRQHYLIDHHLMKSRISAIGTKRTLAQTPNRPLPVSGFELVRCYDRRPGGSNEAARRLLSHPGESANSMATHEISGEPAISLSNLPTTSEQRRAVLVVAVFLVVALAAVAPFADTPLTRLDGFIPSLESVIF